jgi:purine-binding chemotaxis protein CheW
MSESAVTEQTSQSSHTASPASRGPTPPSNATSEVLSFRLGAEEYGIDILKVQEIRGYEAPTRIANSPSYIKGVVNLRGVIVPIVDMRLRLALEKVEYNAFTVTIVLNIFGRTVGMVVDSVSDVLELKAGQIRAAPEFHGAMDSNHITGIGSVRTGETERMLILMDIEQVMASADLGLNEASIH